MVVLHKAKVSANGLAELEIMITFEEKPPFIAKDAGFHHDDFRDGCRIDFHELMFCMG